jgi:N-acetylneuraminate lyase
VDECKELASLAEELKYTGIAFTAPYYFKPKSVEALAECCKQVAAAAPSTDFYYYHIPSFTGANFPMIDLLTRMDADIPNLGGIKYTYENMMDYQQCLYFKEKKYNIMWGRDEMYLEALSIGAVAAVGSTYNYSSKIYLAIQEAFQNGDLSRAADLQYKAVEFITLLNKFGQGTGKAMMQSIGLDLGKHRLPVNNLTNNQITDLKQDLNTMGFFEYASK